MKSRPYPLNLLLYLLLLYFRTYCTYWWTGSCMYVPIVPGTVLTVRARTIPTAVQYVLRTDIRTNCTADVRTYIYISKKRGNAADRYLLHLHSVRTYCTYNTDVRTACTYYWCTHVWWRKKLPAAVNTCLLRYARTYCTYLVLVHLLMYVRTYCTYCCPYWCTYVPTVRTALTNAIV